MVDLAEQEIPFEVTPAPFAQKGPAITLTASHSVVLGFDGPEPPRVG